MELKEIRKIVAEIFSDITANKYAYTFRRYDVFFGLFGMSESLDLKEIKRIERQFRNKGITFWNKKTQVKDLSKFPKGETITFRVNFMTHLNREERCGEVDFAGKVNVSKSESNIRLYKHQEEAFYNLQKQIIKSNANPFAGLLVLPTGGGKTLTAGLWIAKNVLSKNKKVLWVAHRHELLEQARETFIKKLAYVDIFDTKESFNYRILSGIHDKPINVRPTDDLIIASKDSLNAGFDHLYKNWIQNNTDEIFLVVDEAHHATAKTYRKLIDNLRSSVSQFRLLGLTATPTRTAEKEKGLLKKVFPNDIVYKIDLKTLIRLGILSEPIFEEVQTGQSFIEELTDDEIEMLNTFDITSIGEKIAESIAKNRERNYTIVDRYIQNKEKYKQTLVFVLNVDNAIALNKLFQEKGVKSDYVISNVRDAVTGITSNFTKENKTKIDNFRKGTLEVLINVNILTEGTDVPNVQSVFLTRPTISTILMTQMIGRGLRGLKAGGTKEAYIVSFVDDWQERIAWINPEKLFIEENVDFNDVDSETGARLLRLVSIHKIEEFAILTNKIIDPQTKRELEKLDFIQRIPKGIFQFKLLERVQNEERERSCEILVYDNIEKAYQDFTEGLPEFVNYYKLRTREYLSEEELETYANRIEEEFFLGVEKYPAYSKQDIKNMLQYYIIQDEIPFYIELKDREKYDIDKIVYEMYEKDLGPKAQKEFVDKMWEANEKQWQVFFNYDKRIFINEIDISNNRLLYPELYQKNESKIPTEEKELREFERMTLKQIEEINPIYAKWLRDQVYQKYTDKDGYYFSATGRYKSKSKRYFQIDHIKPMHNGGLTTLDNLQLLTAPENWKKGYKEDIE